jgi:acylphosphatase
MQAVRLRITGRVQGVGYRAFVIETGRRLGLRGWVRNRTDGSGEALVIGDEPAVAAMIAACRAGPRAAVVADLAVAPDQDDRSTGFASRPTV